MTEPVKLVGLGLAPRDHATIEALQALADSDEVRAQGFSAGDLSFLKKQCRAGALKSVPANADPKALAAAIAAAAAKGRRVTLATPIHPFYFGPAGAAVVAACAAAKIPWKSFGSISPMGAAISKAGVTLGSNVYGLQSFEAEAYAEKRVEANPVWPLILYFTRKPSAAALAAVSERLLGLYPATREALWCSGARAGKWAPLGDALKQAKGAGVGDTLYLAAARETESKLGRTGYDSFSGKGSAAPATLEDLT